MAQKIKILYLIDTLNIGGAEKSLVEMAIHNPHVENVFVSIYKGNELSSLLKNHQIKVYELNIIGKRNINQAVQKLIPIIKREKPHIVHATLLRSELIARKLKKYFKYKLVGSFVSKSYGKEKYRQLKGLQKLKHLYFQLYNCLTTSKVDLFISNSHSIKKSNSRALCLSSHKVKVIYRGRKSEIYEKPNVQSIESFKKEFGLQSNKLIVSVGRLRITKGFQDIIQVFAQIHTEFPEWKILIAGEGPYRKQLEELIRKHGLQHKVILPGARTDIPVILKSADIFVFPTYLEGLPGSLIEAMFARKPIICTDIAENLECINHQSALIYGKGNQTELKTQLIKLIQTPEKYQYLTKNAYQIALKKFELNHIINKYNKVYFELINQ